LVVGLWIIQQCRAAWHAEKQETDLGRLLTLAENAPQLGTFIDPDDLSFAEPGNMVQRVIDFCERTAQRAPITQGQVVRCVMESQALKYRYVLDQLMEATGRTVEVVHVVGGSAQNPMLCQMTANATHRMVMAGPVDATALG